METLPTLMTAVEVAQRLRIPVSTVYDLSQRRIIPSVRVGRALRFDARDLERFLNGQKAQVGRQTSLPPGVSDGSSNR